MLERLPGIRDLQTRGAFHALSGGHRALAHQLRQPGQRILKPYRQKIHPLLRLLHHLQRRAQSGDSSRAVQPITPPQRCGMRPHHQPPAQIGNFSLQFRFSLHHHFGGRARGGRAHIRNKVG